MPVNKSIQRLSLPLNSYQNTVQHPSTSSHTSLRGEIVAPDLMYWKNKLRGISPLPLPTDFPRPATSSQQTAQVSFAINKLMNKQLRVLEHMHETSLHTILLTALNVLLYRYAGKEDICVGSLSFGEDLPEKGNVLALRTEVRGKERIDSLLSEVTRTSNEASEHRQVPFENVVEALASEWDGGMNPLCQVLFMAQSLTEPKPLHQEEIYERTKFFASNHPGFDLCFTLGKTSEGLGGAILYRTDLYEPSTIERMAAHYQELLRSIIQDPTQSIGSLAMLPADEKRQLMEEFNNNWVAYPSEKTLVDLFEEQVQQTPEAIALVFEEQQLSYQQLNEKANQLAHYLRSKGVQTDTLVPICLERGFEMLIGILGIMKAGGAYVPIDPSAPADRMEYMLQDCQAKLVLTTTYGQSKLAAVASLPAVVALDTDWPLIAQQASTCLDHRVQPADLSYVIYTSGSTGKPKGVLVEHAGMLNHLFSKINGLRMSKKSIVAYNASYTFDISVWQMFSALVCGGTTLIYPEHLIVQLAAFIQAVDQQRVTILEVVPSYLAAVLQEKVAVRLEALEYLMVTGEAVSHSLLAQWFAHPIYRSIPVVNAYGPTEASDDICHHIMRELPSRTNIPLGSPIQNTRIYVVDESMQLCPIGVSGEVCVAGVGVSRGYLNRPDLTAAKFITDPFHGDGTVRMYRTGDLGRWLPDGTVEYLGRIDEQVKIRGFRIELGEIETVLQQCEAVHQAVVMAKKDKQGNACLVGYVVPKNTLDRHALRTYMNSKLPEYMVPSILVELPHLPLTSNGKIDKKALPEPDVNEMINKAYVAPRTALEQKLALLWQELLSISSVGIHDHFFELGGHSLLAAKLIAELNRQTGKKLLLSAAFAYPTIAELAAYIETPDDAIQWDYLVTIQSKGSKPPLYFVHDGRGGVEYGYRLAYFLGQDRPMYGFLSVGLNGLDEPLKTVSAMAEHFVKRLLQHQPQGPYHLASYSGGGAVVHEMARQLAAMGRQVGLLALFDSYPINHSRLSYRQYPLSYIVKSVSNFLFSGHLSFIGKCKAITSRIPTFIRMKLQTSKPKVKKKGPELAAPDAGNIVRRAIREANYTHRLTPYPGRIVFIRAISNPAKYLRNSDFGWRHYAKGGVDVYDLAGDHRAIFREKESLEEVARIVQEHLEKFDNTLP